MQPVLKGLEKGKEEEIIGATISAMAVDDADPTAMILMPLRNQTATTLMILRILLILIGNTAARGPGVELVAAKTTNKISPPVRMMVEAGIQSIPMIYAQSIIDPCTSGVSVIIIL